MGLFSFLTNSSELDEKSVLATMEYAKNRHHKNLALDFDSAWSRTDKEAYSRLLKEKVVLLNDKEFEECFLLVYDQYRKDLEKYDLKYATKNRKSVEVMFPEAQKRGMAYRDSNGAVMLNEAKINDSLLSFYIDNAINKNK